MYVAAQIPIPERSIAAEHWRVLERAVANHEDADPRHGDVYKALEYFQACTVRQGAINLLWAGLRTGNAEFLERGLAQLKVQAGGLIS